MFLLILEYLFKTIDTISNRMLVQVRRGISKILNTNIKFNISHFNKIIKKIVMLVEIDILIKYLVLKKSITKDLRQFNLYIRRIRILK